MPGTPKKPVKAATKAAPAKAVSRSGYGLGLANKPMELELPSGNTCLAIRPGAQGLIKAGLLDSLDQLTAMVQREQIDPHDPKKQVQSAVNSLAANPKDLLEGLEMVDRAVAFVVKEPAVFLDEAELDADGKPLFVVTGQDNAGQPIRKPVFKKRDPDKVYADEVDLEDKMFIFQWAVGGTADLARFRQESADLVGNIPTIQDLQMSSQ